MNFALTDVPVQAIPFREFRQEVEALYSPRFKRPSTRAAIVRVLNMLEDMGVQTTADFTVGLVARVVEGVPKSYSKHTLKGLLLRLQAIMNHAARSGYCARSPFQIRPIRTWVKPGRPKGKRHLTREEIAGIRAVLVRDIAHTSGWIQWRARRLLALFDLISLTGLRRNEALYLQLADIDLERRVITLVDRDERELKTDASAAPVALPGVLVDSLRDWLDHRMDAPPGVKRAPNRYLVPNIKASTPWVHGPQGSRPLDRLQAAAKRAGITEGVTWHALRRSLATHMELHGVGGAMISRLLRHTNQQTTERWYRQADERNMLEAVADFHY
jgi:integrase